MRKNRIRILAGIMTGILLLQNTMARLPLYADEVEEAVPEIAEVKDDFIEEAVEDEISLENYAVDEFDEGDIVLDAVDDEFVTDGSDTFLEEDPLADYEADEELEALPDDSEDVFEYEEAETESEGVYGEIDEDSEFAIEEEMEIAEDEQIVIASIGDISNHPIWTYNGHLYQHSGVVATFADAEAACEAAGGHLATITSAEENQAICDYLISLGGGAAMLGLYDSAGSNGSWSTWVTGETVAYTNWQDRQPDWAGQTICVLESGSTGYYGAITPGQWDNGWDGDYAYICEWDSAVTISLEESYETKAGLETDIIADVYTTLEDVSDIQITWKVVGPGNVTFPATTGIRGDGDRYISPAAFLFSKPGEYTVTASYYNVSDTAVVKVAQPDIFIEDSEQIINHQAVLTAACDSETDIQLTDVEWEIENNNVTRKPIELTETVSGPDGTTYTLTKTVKFLEIGEYTVRVSIGDKKAAATVIVKPDKVNIKEPTRRDDDNRHRSVTAQWEQTDGAAVYEVQWSQDPEDFSECDTEPNKCARYVVHDDTIQSNINYESTYTLERGKEYYIRVRAIGAEGNKDFDEKFAGEWSDVSEPIRAGRQILATELWGLNNNGSDVHASYIHYLLVFSNEPKKDTDKEGTDKEGTKKQGTAYNMFCSDTGQAGIKKVDYTKSHTFDIGICNGLSVSGLLAFQRENVGSFPGDRYGLNSLSDINTVEEVRHSISTELSMSAEEVIIYSQLAHNAPTVVVDKQNELMSLCPGDTDDTSIILRALISRIQSCQEGESDPILIQISEEDLDGSTHIVIPIYVKIGDSEDEKYVIGIYNPNTPLTDYKADNFIYINSACTTWKYYHTPTSIWKGDYDNIEPGDMLFFFSPDTYRIGLQRIARGEVGFPDDAHWVLTSSKKIDRHAASDTGLNRMYTAGESESSSDNRYCYFCEKEGPLNFYDVPADDLIFSKGKYALKILHGGTGDINVNINEDNPGYIEIKPEDDVEEDIVFFGDFDKDGNQEFSYLTVDIAAGETAKISLCPDGSIEFSGVMAAEYVRNEGCMQGDSFTYHEDANESISCDSTDPGRLYQISDASSLVILKSSTDQGATYTQIEAVNEKSNGEDFGQTTSGLPASNSVFPDPVFRQVISDTFDANRDGVLSAQELNAITEIDVSDRTISDFTGIAFFGNLSKILCDNYSKVTAEEAVKKAALPILVVCPDNVALDKKHFPDANLRAYLSTNVDSNGDGILSGSERAAVTAINTQDAVINDFSGIEYFRNLASITCSPSSITPARNSVKKAGMNTSVHLYGTEINSANFPDANFRNLVHEKADTNKDWILSTSEVAALTDLNVTKEGISSLKGVEYLTGLRKIGCGHNSLTTLDLSKNTSLITIDCYYNKLTYLNVSGIANLEGLYAYNNKLTQIDVSQNRKLKKLQVHQNNLRSLDVRNNPELTQLVCYENDMYELDVSRNPKLQGLDCTDNHFTVLDLSKNPELTELYCYQNRLSHVDLTNNGKLKTCYAYGNSYPVTLDKDGRLNLASIPGFQVSKASSWSGGQVVGNMLYTMEKTDTVTFLYKMRNGFGEHFSFTIRNPQISKIPAVIRTNASSITLKKGQKTNAVKVYGLFAADSVKSVRSQNTRIAKASFKSGKLTIVAQKKTGKTKVTITTLGGAKKTITVRVQKNDVKCTGLVLNKTTVKLRKGKSFKITVSKKPLTCIQAVTFQSSNKQIATVSSKGVIKGKRKGRTTITVRCGKKSRKIRVIVS